MKTENGKQLGRHQLVGKLTTYSGKSGEYLCGDIGLYFKQNRTSVYAEDDLTLLILDRH